MWSYDYGNFKLWQVHKDSKTRSLDTLIQPFVNYPSRPSFLLSWLMVIHLLLALPFPACCIGSHVFSCLKNLKMCHSAGHMEHLPSPYHWRHVVISSHLLGPSPHIPCSFGVLGKLRAETLPRLSWLPPLSHKPFSSMVHLWARLCLEAPPDALLPVSPKIQIQLFLL